MKTLAFAFTAALSILSTPHASAQSAPAGFEGIWQTKEWFGTIANLQFVECEDGPYCVEIVSLVQCDGMMPGHVFMSGLKLMGGNLRRGQMNIPNGPSLPGGVFKISDTQVQLQAFGASEIWERVE